MIERRRTRPELTTLSLVTAVLVAVAACTPARDVTRVGSDTTTSPGSAAPTTGAPPATATPEPIDGSTPVTPPDPTGLPSISTPDDAILMGTLDNGLRYVVRDNDNPGGRVEMRLAVDAGSVLEDDTQDGGAHFLEHMLFNGTEEFPENELIAVLRSFGAGFGADINAYTDYDETVYQLTMPTADPTVVATGLDVLEQWLTSATIDQAQVEAERGIVLDEWRGSESSSTGRIFDTLESLFLTGSPYEDKDPIGTSAAIEATDAEPLRRFYDDWYRPDNVGLVVVGDIDPDDIEEGIVERFGPVTARAEARERPEFTVEPSDEPQLRVLADPDVAQGFAQVTLPLASPARDAQPVEAALQSEILGSLAFDMIATRLGNDALRGEAPFEDARVDSSSIVRGLDAPEIVVSADGDDLEDATQAVYDEYERVRRHGFSTQEVARAVSVVQTAADTRFAGRDSRQDADFADEYVGHLLEDEPIPTADAAFDFVTAVLARATPETIAYEFIRRLEASAPHMMVVVPASEADDLAPEEAFLAQAETMRERDVDPREDEAGIDGDLMVAPDPVAERSADRLTDNGIADFIDPVVLEFDNGVTVALNVTTIVEGQLEFEARSPGGLDVVADADVPAAGAAGSVVGRSGVATYDPVTLEAFLADKDVALEPSIDVFTEGWYGAAATSDAEILFQMIHLGMTRPRVDPIVLDQYLDDELPYAADPSIDPGYAEFTTLLDARYDDPRFLLPTVDGLDRVTIEGIERVFRDRFGDASDFAFSFSGDFDVDEMTELARRYLGTLPSTDRVETVDYVEPEPPPGVVAEQTTAGDGEQAVVSFLFTAPASTERRDDVMAQIVAEVVTNRLTDTVREELGESYSPYSMVQLTAGGAPNAETYISNTTGVELVGDVVAAVEAELADLRASGPSAAEFAAATEGVRQQLDLFSNGQVNGEVLAVLTDPAGNASFDEFLDQQQHVAAIDVDDVRETIGRWLPADRYISVRVLPR